MPIPFPGMNPYLEHPDLWPSVHQKMIAALATTLENQLPPSYSVRLRERYYRVSGEDSLVVGTPGISWNAPAAKPPVPALSHASGEPSTDVSRFDGSSVSSPVNRPVTANSEAAWASAEQNSACLKTNKPIAVLIPIPQKIYETYLEIVDTTGTIVTIIEALSPKKKRPGRGRTLYERQRETIFGSPIHFVEIDLLRGWEPPSIYGPDESGDYRILVSRSEQRPRAELYTWTVAEPIPQIELPLSGADELPLCLKGVVDQACDRTDLLVNYQQAPLPPLRYQENIWLEDFLQQVGMRPCAS